MAHNHTRGERSGGLNRRSMLRGLLGGAAVAIGLPTLELFLNGRGDALADGGALPRRFGLWMWGNGMVPSMWTPIGEGADWELSPLMLPLAPVKDVISVVTGMEVKNLNTNPHGSGPTGFLSGMPPLGQDGDSTYGGPTIDQIVANTIGGGTRFRSLQVAAEPGAGGHSYNGPNSQNPADSDPYVIYSRLFGPEFRAPGENVPVDPKLALRRSVLDAVTAQATSLQARLGSNDRARLDQHLTGIRELEARLLKLEQDPPSLAACVRPEEPMAGLSFEMISERHRLITDLLVMALACDQTRVFSMQLTGPVSNWLFPGVSAGYHQLTHDEPGEQPEVQNAVTQIMGEAAYFIEAMRQIPEGDGTLLDNSGVLLTSEVSYGKTHAIDEYPIIVAGSSCGSLVQGIHYRSTTKENAGMVPLTLMRASGVTLESFGVDALETTTGLSALEA